jgi:putative alpha-1,2-mannosidase
MSAWYVLSAMGFYPSCPGTPKYSIGSPLFSRIVIHQQNGKDFTIDARGYSGANLYVRSARLNGSPLPAPSFAHSDIVNGSTLVLNMGAMPVPQAFQSAHASDAEPKVRPQERW